MALDNLPERQDMRVLHTQMFPTVQSSIVDTFKAQVTAGTASSIVISRLNFAPSVDPGNGIITALPNPSTPFEEVESVFAWDGPQASEDFASLAVNPAYAYSAANNFVSPFTAQGIQIETPRYFWLFRGTDRRILEGVLKCLTAMESRDLKVNTDAPTSAISIREYMIDPLDEELLTAFYVLIDHITQLLSLVRS